MKEALSPPAGELYNHVDGKHRYACVDGDQIKFISYHDAKPDNGDWRPVVHADTDLFDAALHWRLAPVYLIEADRVLCTYPVVEHA